MDLPMYQVHLIPILSDNYAFLISHGKKAILIDPGTHQPVLSYIDKHKFILEKILITHHHTDHTGGLKVLSKNNNISVIGPSKSKIPFVTDYVEEGEVIEWEGLCFKVMEIPGHTLDHLAYHECNQKWLFSGDVLFGSGCGRIFEGTFDVMYKSLSLIIKFSPDTQIYCGHEYTLQNCKFAKTLCEFSKFQKRYEEVLSKRNRGVPSIPLSLQEELNCNPFLLTGNVDFQKLMGCFDARELFQRIRELRDAF